MAIKPGSQVVLQVPENQHLHGQTAIVVTLTDWGAHVATKVGSGFFRAMHSEMLLLADTNGKHGAQATHHSRGGETMNIRESGYTGNVCGHCQSSRMIRRGACEYCEDCGTASGGCG